MAAALAGGATERKLKEDSEESDDDSVDPETIRGPIIQTEMGLIHKNSSSSDNEEL